MIWIYSYVQFFEEVILKEKIHEAFRKEWVFVTSPLNYIVYEAGFRAGLEYAQKTAHNKVYTKCIECDEQKDINPHFSYCPNCGMHFV